MKDRIFEILGINTRGAMQRTIEKDAQANARLSQLTVQYMRGEIQIGEYKEELAKLPRLDLLRASRLSRDC